MFVQILLLEKVLFIQFISQLNAQVVPILMLLQLATIFKISVLQKRLMLIVFHLIQVTLVVLVRPVLLLLLLLLVFMEMLGTMKHLLSKSLDVQLDIDLKQFQHPMKKCSNNVNFVPLDLIVWVEIKLK